MDVKGLTRRELRDVLATGSDGITALEALQRLRWDSSTRASLESRRVMVGLLLSTLVSTGTCRGFVRFGSCKYGASCRYEHAFWPLSRNDLAAHRAAQGQASAVTVVRLSDPASVERMRAEGEVNVAQVVHIEADGALVAWESEGAPRVLVDGDLFFSAHALCGTLADAAAGGVGAAADVFKLMWRGLSYTSAMACALRERERRLLVALKPWSRQHPC